MGGINQCIDYMISDEGKKENQIYLQELNKFRKNLKKLKNIKLMDGKSFDYDISKIVLCCKGRGTFLYKELLEEYQVQLEMAADDYVIAMTSIGDQPEWYEILYNALTKIDVELESQGCITNIYNQERYDIIKAEIDMKPSEALESDGELVDWSTCVGRTAQEIIYAYPPGVPLVYPGERFTEELVTRIGENRQAGITIKGFTDGTGEKVLCIR